MSVSSMLTRLKQQLYPLVQQNTVSDAMLTGPADALAVLDGSLDMMLAGGRYLEQGSVTIPGTLNSLVQVPGVERLDAEGLPVTAALVDWTALFRVGDEVIVGGSSLGNNGLREVTAVNTVLTGPDITGYTLTVSPPFVAAETGLVYGKPTFMLRQLCREMLLYPGGYETDTELRALLADWIETMQRRGTRLGLKTEVNRLTNSTTTELLETVTPLRVVNTGRSYTQSTQSLNVADPDLSIGQSVTVTNSSEDSNGRYTVYTNTGSTIVLGHRAASSRSYRTVREANALEVQFREDRVNSRLWVRVVNTGASSAEITLTLDITAGTIDEVSLPTGTGSISHTASNAALTLTTSSGSTSAPNISEAVVMLSGTSSATIITPAITSGTPTQVRLGLMGLCPTGTDGNPVLASIAPWRWGALVRTGLRSRSDESGLTLLASARPGWYLGLSSPDSVEEDAYTMTSPDEFTVVEADHRNPTNYTEQDLERLVRDVLLPADVDGALRLT
jgi:hypothetical protein